MNKIELVLMKEYVPNNIYALFLFNFFYYFLNSNWRKYLVLFIQGFYNDDKLNKLKEPSNRNH